MTDVQAALVERVDMVIAFAVVATSLMVVLLAVIAVGALRSR